MKIVDCFIFYNELDMLKFRLEYLYDTVDYFVLVEATVTHSGNPKPLFFESNKHMFSKYLHKIIHIVVSDMPKPPILKLLKLKNTNIHWQREIYQRKCINRGIEKLSLHNDDVIIISDLDEIPNRNIFKTTRVDRVYSLVQDLYYYNLTLQQKNKWIQSKICDYKSYKFYKNDPQFIRMIQTSNLINNGGWHFSYFGNVDFIINKIRNFCHYDWFENLSYDEIKNKIENGNFLLDSQFTEIIKIPIEENTNLPEGYESLI